MIYRDFGRTGWKVSAVGQGTWNIGNQWGKMDDARAFAKGLGAPFLEGKEIIERWLAWSG